MHQRQPVENPLVTRKIQDISNTTVINSVQDQMQLRPTFLVIGGRRCGTNWLQQCLMEHPDIFVPPGRPSTESIDEKSASAYKNEPAIGLVNASWLTTPECSRELAARYRGAKLITILRSPVDRAYSWYWQCLKQGDGIYSDNPTFEVAMEQDPTILEEGYFHRYLTEFFNLFPKEDRLVLFFDLLKKDATAYVQIVYEFLSVDANFAPSILNERVNYSTGIKSRIIHQTLRKMKSMVLKASKENMWLVHRLENSKIVERARRLNEKDFPAMNSETRRRLCEIYENDVQALASALNQDLAHWIDK